MRKQLNPNSAFKYTGISSHGKIIKGIIYSRNIIFAKMELRRQGIITKKISKQLYFFKIKSYRRITPKDITIFTRQLATMIEAGIPLALSFDIVIKGQKNKNLAELFGEIKSGVETGLNLSEALSKHSKYFNNLYCSLIEASEKSATLEIMLKKIANFREKRDSVNKKVKKALIYPAAIVIIAVLVTVGLLIFVIPQFEALFNSFNAELPLITKIIIKLSKFFQSFWYLFFLSLGSIIYAIIYCKKNNQDFEFFIDKRLLKLPVIGNIFANAAIARFTGTLAITHAAGLPFAEILQIAAKTTDNKFFSNAVFNIQREVITGQRLQVAMETCGLFPDLVIQMIAIGEDTGNLEQMLGKINAIFEEKVDLAVATLTSLLEPIIMTILGILIGGLVIALYLPVFKLGSII